MKIIDGGFGTTLRDIFGNKSTDLWSLSPLINGEKDVYRKCHQMFIDAGSDVIITANYCATPHYFKKSGLYTSKIGDYIKECGCIAQDLKLTNVNLEIAGSIPPYGESYNPDKLTEDSKLIEHYTVTINCLADYIDYYFAETIASSREAILIYLTYLKCQENIEISDKKDLYLSFCIKEDGETLLDGSNLYQILPRFNDVKGVLFNCCPPENARNGLERLSKFKKDNNLDILIGAYPNLHQHIPENFSLDPETIQEKIVYRDLNPCDFCNICQKWSNEYEIDFLGGCCGITPDFIKKLSRLKSC